MIREPSLGWPLVVIMIVGLLSADAPGETDSVAAFIGFIRTVMSAAGLLASWKAGAGGATHR